MFRCQLWSWEWSKRHISGWQHMSAATADIISPYLMSWYWHAFSIFLGVFLSSFRTAQRDREDFQRFRSSCADLGSVPASSGCLSALKAVCVTTASHLAPERCKLPFLFCYFLPFIEVQAWRIFFFNYSGPALSENTHILKDNNNTETPNQNQKLTHQKRPELISVSPCSKTSSEQETEQPPKGISCLFY